MLRREDKMLTRAGWLPEVSERAKGILLGKKPILTKLKLSYKYIDTIQLT